MTTKAIRAVLLPALLLVGTGCSEDVESDDVGTEAVYADIWVDAYGNGESHVSTTLRVGGNNSNTYLELTEYDALMAFVNDTSRGMSASDDDPPIVYRTTFPYEAEDTPFRIAFLRTPPPDGECAGRSAPNSLVTLPRPFEITSPADSASVPRSAPLDLTWSNSGEADDMWWEIEGPCIQYVSDTIENDDGSFSIPANTVMVVGTNQAASCTATLSVHRTRPGDLDENYGEGGRIDAAQHRAVQFTTVQ